MNEGAERERSFAVALLQHRHRARARRLRRAADPSRVIDGALIEVAVPEKYRNADGELSLQVRTDRGGYSETQ